MIQLVQYIITEAKQQTDKPDQSGSDPGEKPEQMSSATSTAEKLNPAASTSDVWKTRMPLLLKCCLFHPQLTQVAMDYLTEAMASNRWVINVCSWYKAIIKCKVLAPS